MKIQLAACLAIAACAAAAHCAEPKKRSGQTRRSVPAPYPAIIKLPRVAEAPDRPATGVLLYDTDLSGRELAFLQTAHEAGARQLGLAQLARERAEDAQIKAVAETLATTQVAENQQVLRLASLKGLSLNAPAGAGATADFDGLKGVKFDKRWIERLVAVNNAAVTAYESATQSADTEIKAFAEAMLPLAQAKLQIANRLAGRTPAAAAAR